MNRALAILVFAQFLSAFGDNALLFTVIAMVMQAGGRPAWYIAALQGGFLLAFVVLMPWVGSLADRFAKPRVLAAANAVKGLGTLALLLGVEPLAGYAIVGVGAASYSPAKYGILPELTAPERLVRGNAWIEGATIVAVLSGTLGGALLADRSVELALVMVLGLFLLSAVSMRFLPALPGRRVVAGAAYERLRSLVGGLLRTPRAGLILLSLSLFWASAATLRVVLVSWAPEVLGSRTASDIAGLTLFVAVGIVLGSVLVPRLIPLARIQRTRFAAYALGLLFTGFALVTTLWTARLILLAIGVAAGLFVVPLNASIQQLGYHSVGSGAAVAVQNLFQNGSILLGLGLYAAATAAGVKPASVIGVFGALVAVTTWLVSTHLNRRTGSPAA